MTKMLQDLKEALKAVRCPHKWGKYQARPIPAGCETANSWTRKCPKCGMRETTFKRPRHG